MRIFSIAEWDLFAWMIISLALLGFGASGTALAIFRKPARRFYPAVAVIIPSILAVVLPLTLALALRVEWRSLELLWNPGQAFRLLVIYLILSGPFFCVGTFIGLNLMEWAGSIRRVYGADLAGAAAGAVIAAGLLQLVRPEAAWQMLTALSIASAGLIALAIARRLWWVPVAGGLLAAATSIVLPLQIEPGEYKALSQALRVPGADIIAQGSSAQSDLRMLANSSVPLRLAPGLSLNHFDELPLQRGIYVDGEGPVILNRSDEALRHVDDTVFGAALALDVADDSRRALVVGLNALPEIVRLHQVGFESIIVLEPDTRLSAMALDAKGWGGEILESERVELRGETLRAGLANVDGELDLILISLDAGRGSLEPERAVTEESFGRMLDRLGDDGLIAISAPVETPPRSIPRLLVAIANAVERRNDGPERHVAALRGWDRGVILLRKSPFTSSDTASLRRFAESHSFDLVWLAGEESFESNRFNQLAEPWFRDSAAAILGSRSARRDFIERYKFDLTAPTDDRPWFGVRMKTGTVRELLARREEGGLALLESGYPVLVLTLVIAIVSGVVLILLPLRMIRRERHPDLPAGWRIVTTFGALGLAFLFVEIVAIHRIAAILGRPLEAVTIVIASFLLFAGAGSLLGRRLPRLDESSASDAVLLRATVAITVVILLDLSIFMVASDWIAALPHAAKVAVSVVAIAPLAFLMGIPFPAALERIRSGGDSWIAWAWGVNGCASVVSAILAVLLSIHFGLNAVSVSAAALYVVAGVALKQAV